VTKERTRSTKDDARRYSSPQSAARDPLEQLARMCALVLAALDRIDEQKVAASKEGNLALESALQLRHTELEDRRQALEQEASFLLARSATGALFQAMIASNELHSLITAPQDSDAHAIVRRIQRYLFSVVRFLDTIGAEKMERVRQYYAPDYLDPLAALAAAIREE
jgi:hypothetical protein